MKPNFYAHGDPVDWDRSNEVKLLLSAADRKRFDAIPANEENICNGVIVKDCNTGRYFAIRHFPCFIDSLDCCCAAQAREVAGPKAKVTWQKPDFPEDEVCDHCHQPI